MTMNDSSKLPAMPRKTAPAGAANSEAVDAADLARLSDTRGPIRTGFWVLVVGLGLFLAWAAWAPLDEGVSVPANVSVESRRKPIQHMEGGTVRSLAVREGSLVQAGDLLVELEDASIRAARQGALQNYLSQRALEGRLLAELSGAARISFHPDLLNSDDSTAAGHMAVQQQIFEARRSGRNADLSALREVVRSLEAQLAGLEEIGLARREQRALQARQLEGMRALAEEGFAPRNQALQLQQSQSELAASVAEIEANRLRLRASLGEAKLRLVQREQDYLRDSSNNLADVQREVRTSQERLSALTKDLARTRISAPVAGEVVGLQAYGRGSVISPGARLMDILPEGEALLLDVKVPPSLIDRVQVGNEVEVRFAAFTSQPHLVVLGELKSISGDAVSENVNGVIHTHYLGRVALKPEGLKALGSATVLPGMTAEVLIKSGERSLLTYLMTPLTKRIAKSMTEQ